MTLVGRKVLRFRCQIDPMIWRKPMNAFVPSDMGMSAHITDGGVYVKVESGATFEGGEHLIPFANIQSIRLEPESLDVMLNRKAK